MKSDFSSLFAHVGFEIDDPTLIQNVFVHRSYLNEHKRYHLPSNEKLEFLGDSVLSLITSIHLYRNYPDLAEGEYTDIKAAVVRTESLAECAKEVGVGECLLLSKGEESNGGRSNKNILADCLEAFIAAIFLNKGFDTAYEFTARFLFGEKLDHIVKNKLYLSPKSHLQEVSQDKFKKLPVYEVIGETGPEHDKEYEVRVSVGDALSFIARGKSKKSAEEAAATSALEKLASS